VNHVVLVMFATVTVLDGDTFKFDGVNAFNSTGQTPLHNAAQFGHPTTVELLINSSADVNARKPYKSPTCDGKLPLQSAIYTMGSLENRLATIKLLLSAGADLSISSGYPALTPVQYAESYMNIVKHGYNDDEEERKSPYILWR
jgi:ankyrin repeat protein